MASRSRLDQLLVDRDLATSRSLARRLILAGKVQVDGQRADKPGSAVNQDASVRVAQPPRFVSRGGDKLDPVLVASGVEATDKVCLDVGASTGGFTDCLLQHGARQVIAVDVGYGQLDWKLRQDDRVVVLERCNARHLQREDLGELPAPQIVVMDVSFIGAAKLLPALDRVCAPECEALLLVKPQFECGPERVEKGGVVRDPEARRDAVRRVADATRQAGWVVVGVHPSPLRGPAGNWECFLHVARGADVVEDGGDAVEALAVPDDRARPRRE